MAILFHPAHKKFIKLLRSYADRDTIINITEQDQERYLGLFHRTNISLERHKAVYKLVLEILNRNTPVEEGYPFTHEMVDKIEQMLIRAERRKPCNTFRGVVIMPLLRHIIRRM